MMNRNLILKLCAAACVIALCVCCASMAGRALFSGTKYANADKYTAGGAVINGTVKKLDIHWIDGAVAFAKAAGSSVELSETAKNPISKGAQLRWWLDGDTLRVQYAKNGFFSLRSLNKALTVALPEGLALEDVQLEATSADVTAPQLRANAVTVSLTSGDVELTQLGEADRVALSSTSGELRATLGGAKALTVGTTSGDIKLALTGASDSAALSSTSGDISIELDSAKALSADTTSGAIKLTANALEEASLTSTSGNITAQTGAFDALKIGATSGDVTAVLPEAPGFSARIDTTSGSFDSDIPLKQDGNRYACGDERAQLTIDTTSGDVRLKAE